MKNLRNFYLEAEVDGKKTKMVGGPKHKDGGMNINLFVRDKGELMRAVSIDCFVGFDPNELIIRVKAPDTDTITINTKRN